MIGLSSFQMLATCTQLHQSKQEPLYYQQHTLEIIQLDEAPPPPPRRLTSLINSSAAGSSSSSYGDDDSFYSSSQNSSSSASSSNIVADEDDGDAESMCSSYCSSDMPPEDSAGSSVPSGPPHSNDYDDSHTTRMARIIAWRDEFSASCTSTEPLHRPPLKRKISEQEPEDSDDDAGSSHSSKRSRSQGRHHHTHTSAANSAYPCPACDSFFSSRQALQHHGCATGANEACRAAVLYAFE
jgi:hypothetical protein